MPGFGQTLLGRMISPFFSRLDFVKIPAIVSSFILSVSSCLAADYSATISKPDCRVIVYEGALSRPRIGCIDLDEMKVTTQFAQPQEWNDSESKFDIKSPRKSGLPESSFGGIISTAYRGMESVVSIPDSSVYYVVYQGELYEVNDRSGLATRLKRPEGGKVAAITYDSTRNRLVAISDAPYMNQTYQLSYRDLKTKQWSCKPEISISCGGEKNTSLQAYSMLYRQSDDSIYVLFGALPHVPCGLPAPKYLKLARVASDGQVVDCGRIEGTMSLPGSGRAIQLLSTGSDQLFVLVPSGSVAASWTGTESTQCYPVRLTSESTDGTRGETYKALGNGVSVTIKNASANAYENSYGSYFSHVAETLSHHPLIGSQRKLRGTGLVHLRINRHGEVLENTPEEALADSDAISFALSEMVQRAGKLPAFPHSWPDEIHVDLKLEINAADWNVSSKLARE